MNTQFEKETDYVYEKSVESMRHSALARGATLALERAIRYGTANDYLIAQKFSLAAEECRAACIAYVRAKIALERVIKIMPQISEIEIQIRE